MLFSNVISKSNAIRADAFFVERILAGLSINPQTVSTTKSDFDIPVCLPGKCSALERTRLRLPDVEVHNPSKAYLV